MGLTHGIALTPSLYLGDQDKGDADTIREGGIAVVSSKPKARAVLEDLGVDEALIQRALSVADGLGAKPEQLDDAEADDGDDE